MKQVTLRPAVGLGPLKAVIAAGVLMLLGLPVLLAADHINAAIVAVTGVFCVAVAAVGAFLGWLGLDMRVLVEPDAVRIYYFVPKPAIIPRELIADVRTGWVDTGGRYVPRLVLTDGRSRIVAPLTVRTKEQAEEQAAKLRTALQDVAPTT